MNKSQDALNLIAEFRDFCLSRGTDPIKHTNWGGSGWFTCAVGEFGASKQIDGDLMACMLRSAFNGFKGNCDFMMSLGDVGFAELHYPTFDKLAEALTSELYSNEVVA